MFNLWEGFHFEVVVECVVCPSCSSGTSCKPTPIGATFSSIPSPACCTWYSHSFRSTFFPWFAQIDFGASREYGRPFVDEYLRMVHACVVRDTEACLRHS